MKTAHLIFPHQLFKPHPLAGNNNDCWLIESTLYFTQYQFHQQKIAFHRASMKAFAEQFNSQVNSLTYVDAQQKQADIKELVIEIQQQGFTTIKTIDTTDDWLESQLTKACDQANIQREVLESPMFLSERSELEGFFRTDKEHYFHHQFYQRQRKRLDILMNGDKPHEGQWSFDADNRKKYPKSKQPPEIKFPSQSDYHVDAEKYVQKNYSKNLGNLKAQHGQKITYPVTHQAADDWLDQFLSHRFAEFGDYEDAMVKQQLILHHSVLTPMLNIGLLAPNTVIERALSYATEHGTPINTVEGFVRQIIGWREFIRGLYETIGRQQRTHNFWQFKRPIPASFYTGDTGIEPVDVTIKKVLDTGYCHHIERLMVLGNFMLLCEFDPDAVYQWFMELFIDAYDWVMVPNVYGMSQFADGGSMATKPYISSSNYILKMSDYSGGKQSEHWRSIWDGLFWRFMHQQRSFFESNPRIGMLLKTWDRMDDEKQQCHLDHASNYLASLD